MKPRIVGDRVQTDGRTVPAERLPRTGLERNRRARRHGRSWRSGSCDGPHGSIALVNAATPAELPAVRWGLRSAADTPSAVDADEALVDGLDDRRVALQTLDLRVANGAWVM